MKCRNKLLWELIKSLDYSEILKFKERAFEKEHRYPRYVKLFDAIQKQDSYNEEVIKDELAGEPFLKHLHRTKNYLYHKILEFIRDAHKDDETQLNGYLEKLKILFDKRLYHHIEPLVKKAKEISLRLEDFSGCRKLLEFQVGVLKYHAGKKSYNEQIDSIIAQEREVWKKEQNLVELQLLERMFLKVWETPNPEREKIINSTLLNPIVSNPDSAISASARIVQLQIMFIAYHLIGKYQNVIEVCDKIIGVFQKNQGLIEDKGRFRSLGNVIYHSASFRLMQWDFAGANEQMKKIRSLANAHKRSPGFCLEQETLFDLAAAYKALDFELGFEALVRYKNFERGHPIDLDHLCAIKISHLGAIIGIMAGKPQNALPWILRNRNQKSDTVRPDLLRFSRLLFVLCHWELENHDVIEREVRSIRTSFGRSQIMNEYYDFFLSIFSDLIRGKLPKVDILNSALKRIIENSEDPLWAQMSNYFDLENWIRAIVNGRTYKEQKYEEIKGYLPEPPEHSPR